jgi:two-component system, OmpR family, alkaline phosphatase synthesis response regulator PhoP
VTLLFADDDPLTLDTLAACAESEGYHCLRARNGQEALSLWQQHKPALICLDIMMPKLDGYEVCRRIRSQDTQVPILFLSAKSEEIDVVAGLQLGADDFVRKPFGKAELLARIRAAARRAPLQREAEFALSDLIISPAHLKATRSNQPTIDLTPREVALLRCFAQHAGQVLTRDALLDQCWGIDYYPESRTLDQHIAKLRHKIELDPEHPIIIETVRGAGYRSCSLHNR